jgi:hypothetical protein
MVSVRDVATRWSAVDARARRTANRVSWWTILAAVGVPLVLAGGWTVAAALQPAGSYDWTTRSISALANANATDRWVMTGSFVGYGACQVLTALGLRVVHLAGRLVLGGAGATAALLAAVPATPGGSPRHAMVAGVTSVLLALWPVFAFGVTGPLPWFLRPQARVLIAMAMLLMIAGYCVVLRLNTYAGAVERASAVIESAWPALLVVTLRRLGGSVSNALALEQG